MLSVIAWLDLITFLRIAFGQEVLIGNKISEIIIVQIGVPQESLFLLFINDFPKFSTNPVI